MINAIATILALTAIMCFIVGMIKPEHFKDPDTKQPLSRSMIAKMFLGLFAISAVVAFATKDSSDVENPQIVQNTSVVAESVKTEPVVEPEPAPPPVSFRIISDEKMANIKRTVEVVLETPITEDQVRSLANKIRDLDSKKYERTFILYRIDGVELPLGMAWATSHFNPNLEVNMLADQQGIEVKK